jgi:hypothetical protein
VDLAVLAIIFVFGFFAGRVYETVKQAKDRESSAYLALSNEGKLIAQIEENMHVREIRRLIDVAELDCVRHTDGITPIIATMRYVPNNKNYQNSSRRYRILYEIVPRLPKERLNKAINAQDHKGWTALMYAAEQSDALGGALLIHLGADPALRNPQGETAAAVAQRWPSIVPIFEGKTTLPTFSAVLKAMEGRWPWVRNLTWGRSGYSLGLVRLRRRVRFRNGQICHSSLNMCHLMAHQIQSLLGSLCKLMSRSSSALYVRKRRTR